MSDNIHGINDFGGGINNSVGISNTASQSPNTYLTGGGKDDRIVQSEIYNIKTVTFWLLAINIFVYCIQRLVFNFYYQSHGLSWTCLTLNFGAQQGGKIVHHYQYFRLITPIFLHNSARHILSNSLSLFFMGFHTENEVGNKVNYALLYFISGIIGNLNSLIFKQDSISVGASGAIIGLCGNFVIYFFLNYSNMSHRKKLSYGTMFLILFMNLFSGLGQGGEHIDMASHIGGFLGGFAFSTILAYRKISRHQFHQMSSVKKMYYCAIAFLVILPIVSLIVINTKKVSNIGDFVCKIKEIPKNGDNTNMKK